MFSTSACFQKLEAASILMLRAIPVGAHIWGCDISMCAHFCIREVVPEVVEIHAVAQRRDSSWHRNHRRKIYTIINELHRLAFCQYIKLFTRCSGIVYTYTANVFQGIAMVAGANVNFFESQSVLTMHLEFSYDD